MAKERLSKIQKWILERCREKLNIHYRDVRIYFGKKYLIKKPQIVGEGWDLKKYDDYNIEKIEHKYRYSDEIWHGYRITPKQELLPTNSEKVIASRSLKNLADKGMIVQDGKWGRYTLTKRGFLKVNNLSAGGTFVNYKGYLAEIEKQQKKAEACLAGLRSLIPKS